jgi:hypothetical protein
MRMQKIVLLLCLFVFFELSASAQSSKFLPRNLDYSDTRLDNKIRIYPIVQLADTNDYIDDGALYRYYDFSQNLIETDLFDIEPIYFYFPNDSIKKSCGAYEFRLNKSTTVEPPYRLPSHVIIDGLGYEGDLYSLIQKRTGSEEQTNLFKKYLKKGSESAKSKVLYLNLANTAEKEALKKFLYKPEINTVKAFSLFQYNQSLVSIPVMFNSEASVKYRINSGYALNLQYYRQIFLNSRFFLFSAGIQANRYELFGNIPGTVRLVDSNSLMDLHKDVYNRVYYWSGYSERSSIQSLGIQFGLHRMMGSASRIEAKTQWLVPGITLGIGMMYNPEISFSADTFAIASIYRQYNSDTIFNQLFGNETLYNVSGNHALPNLRNMVLTVSIPLYYYYFLSKEISIMGGLNVQTQYRLSGGSDAGPLLNRDVGGRLESRGVIDYYGSKLMISPQLVFGVAYKI